MGAAHPPPLYGILVLQTTLFTVGHHGAAADCIPRMIIIQLSADGSRDAWTWFAGDLSACDASPHDSVLQPRHGLVDACCLATIATQVTVARQARIESDHGECSRSFGAFLGPHSD